MKSRKVYDAQYRAKRKENARKFYATVGPCCWICGTDKKLICHRTDWKRHKDLVEMSFKELSCESPSNYVRLCYPCHYGVHWLHNNFGMTWNDILALRAVKDIPEHVGSNPTPASSLVYIPSGNNAGAQGTLPRSIIGLDV